jgi:hypothetical protein
MILVGKHRAISQITATNEFLVRTERGQVAKYTSVKRGRLTFAGAQGVTSGKGENTYDAE